MEQLKIQATYYRTLLTYFSSILKRTSERNLLTNPLF